MYTSNKKRAPIYDLGTRNGYKKMMKIIPLIEVNFMVVHK